MVLHEAAEMYLETILILQQDSKTVRAIDIAKRMGHSRATVSEWMRKLIAAGYLSIEDNGAITFTESGLREAQRVYERHVLLNKLFESIGVDAATAAQDACRVEHYISEETFTCLKRHFEEHASS